MKITYRPATLADARDLAPRLRAADAEEVWAATGRSARDVLTASVRTSSLCIAAEVDGRCEGLFGVVPISPLSGEAGVWMLASDVADQHARAWLVEAPQWLVLLSDGWLVLRNRVDARNKRSIRWLRRMGFEVGPAEPWGWAGQPFREFRMDVKELAHV